MKKLAVVLGVAAVATLTGCRDQDYDATHGKQVQDEPKSIETTPAKPAEVTTTKTVETTTVTTEIKTVEAKCMCAPGTKHTSPCTCGASDCKCIVVAPEIKPLPPPAPEYTVYIVQNGDYLAKISKKYNVTINSIKRLNNLKSDKIRVGQKLKLPGKIDVGVQTAPVTVAPSNTAKTSKKSFTPYTGATKEYVVKNGDTLGSVAYGNGLNIRQLKQLNNLATDGLRIGQKLKVPAEKAATKTAMPVVDAKAADKAKAVEAPKPVEPASVETTPAPTTEVAPTADATTPAPVEATPAPTADATTPAPAPVATTTYVVKEGEDLTRIAVDFGVTTSVIRELNNLGENDTVKPGQVLKLPAEEQQ